MGTHWPRYAALHDCAEHSTDVGKLAKVVSCKPHEGSTYMTSWTSQAPPGSIADTCEIVGCSPMFVRWFEHCHCTILYKTGPPHNRWLQNPHKLHAVHRLAWYSGVIPPTLRPPAN